MIEKLTGLNFFEALEIVAGTERGIFYKKSTCYTVSIDPTRGLCFLFKDSGEICNFTPSFEEMKEKSWSVEPENSKVISVWGVCDDDGVPNVFLTDKVYKDTDVVWTPEDVYESLENLFSKDKLAKYLLMSADQPPAAIPWKKFVAEDMPSETFECLVYKKDAKTDFLSAVFWCKDFWSGDGGSWTYYCPVSDLNLPE